MFIGQGIVLPHSSIRVSNLSAPLPVVSIIGLTDNPTYGPAVQIGEEAGYGAYVSSGVIEALSWGQMRDFDNGGTTQDYGDGPAPASLVGAEGTNLVLGVLIDGTWFYSPEYVIREAPPQQGTLTLGDVFEGEPGVAVDVSNALTGSGIALTLVAPPAGISLSGTMLTIDGAQLAAQTDVTLTIRGTNTGGSAEISASFDVIASEISALVPPTIGNDFYETQAFADVPDIATFQDMSNYVSASGVTGVVAHYVLNGIAAVATDTLLEGDSWRIDFVVSQNVGAERVFSLSGTCQNFITTTSLPDNVLLLTINPIVPATETFDLDFGTSTYEDVAVGLLRPGPYHAGGAGIIHAGPESELSENDTLTAEFGDNVVTTTEANITNIQWHHNGVAIPGATADTYSVSAADIGAALTLSFDLDDGVNPALSITTSAVNIAAATPDITAVLAAAAEPKALWNLEDGHVFEDSAGTDPAELGDPVYRVVNQSGSATIAGSVNGKPILVERTHNAQTLRYARNGHNITRNLSVTAVSRGPESYFAFVGFLDTALAGNDRFTILGGGVSTAIGQASDGNTNSWIVGNTTPTAVYINGTAFTGATRDDIWDAVPKDQPIFFEIFLDLTDTQFDQEIRPFYAVNAVNQRCQSEVGPGIYLSAPPNSADRQTIKDHFAALAGITII